MSYIPEYHENYYRVEGTAYNQGKIGIGTINPVQLLHVSGGNIRLDGTGYVNGDLNVTGNLNVYGSTAQFAVSQVIAEDKSIELNVATGTPIGGGNYTTVAFTNDAGAEDGGLILKSNQGDKILAYKTATPNSGWVSNQRWIVSGNYGKDTLQLSDTTANVGMTIGTDANSVNLYRSTNNTLKTDDNLIVDLNLTANGNATLGDATTDTHIVNGTLTNNLPDNTAAVVDLKESTNSYIKLDTTNTSELVTIGAIPKFTSLNTTEATASAAAGATFAGGVGITKKLWVGGNFQVEGNTILGLSDTNTISIYGPTTFLNANSASKGLLIGTDANLYRSAADTLRTDDSLIVNANLNVNGTGYLNTLSGSYIRLNNSPVIINSDTTGEALLHLRANSTRPILAQSEFSGVTFAYQPSFIDKNSIVHLYARNGATVTDHFGFGSLNTMGVATARAVTGTSFYTATKRMAYTTTTLANPVGFRDDGFPQWMRGGSGFGGFYFKSRFGIGEMDVAISGRSRGFIGVTSLIGNILSNNPSTRNVDMLGIGFDSGDNTWSFLHNSGANNSTKIPLRNYDCTRSSGNFIEFTMYAIPSSGVGFHANIANSGNTFSTGYYATTNLPALGTMMAPNVSLYHPIITSTSGIALDINGVYIESYR